MSYSIKILCIATVAAASFAGVATAQQSGAPQGLRKEKRLPSRYPYVVQDALRHCKPKKGFWVDLGAGKGQVAIPLIEATDNLVVMLDPNEEAMAEGLKLAREKGLHTRLAAVVGVAEDMPFLNNSVDFVVSRGSIFFWDDPAKGLKEVYRILRPGGRCLHRRRCRERIPRLGGQGALRTAARREWRARTPRNGSVSSPSAAPSR